MDGYRTLTANQSSNRLAAAAYDDDGNLTSYQGSSYVWDQLGQLAAVNTGSESWVHTYDAFGERVWSWRTDPARLDTIALRGPSGEVLSDFTEVGTAYTWEDYVYREGALLGARLSDGTVRHFDLDHLGSVRLETDASGATIQKRDFWPFGEEVIPPANAEEMAFTGHERDLGVLSSVADDIDYMHARYYRSLARFLSGDPRGGVRNRYAYTTGNPLKFIDPDGRVIVPTFEDMQLMSHFVDQLVDVVATHTSVTAQFSAGLFLGGAIDVTLWPRPADATFSLGHVTGLSGVLTGNLSSEPVGEQKFSITQAMGKIWGAQIQASYGFIPRLPWIRGPQLLAGLGFGGGWSSSATIPLVHWTNVNNCDNFGSCDGGSIEWFFDQPDAGMGALGHGGSHSAAFWLWRIDSAAYSLGTFRTPYDLFESGAVCIESVCR